MAAMPVALETTIVKGRIVRYVDAGNAASERILVLIHGFPLGVQMWEPQLSAFEGWRVLAPALPGFDGSDPIPEPSIDAYGRHVVGLLDALGLKRVTVAGLSMGGYVAFSLLRQASDRITALILADTRSGADSPEASAGRQRMLDLVARSGANAV